MNLAKYMDATAKNIFEAYMETETNQCIEGDNLDDNTFFDVYKRYPWEDIKKWVIKTMYCKPRHGDSIVVFRLERFTQR